MQDNRKRYGYKMKKIQSLTEDECIQRCDDNSECSHTDWYKNNGNCYLRKYKDTPTWKTSSRCDDCGLNIMSQLKDNRKQWGLYSCKEKWFN